MPFNFGGPDFPVALKFVRSLLISEAILFLFAALISLLLDVANGGSSGSTSSSTTVSPALLVISLLAAALLVYLAMDLRNLKPMTRNIIVATQVILFVSTLVTSLSEPISVGLVTLLVAGILYCLLMDKSAQAAFATGTTADGGTGAKSPAAEAKSKEQDDKVQEILKKAAALDAEQKSAKQEKTAESGDTDKA